VLADQADLSGAASLPTKAEKGRFVYETLLSKAQTTQEPILQLLRDRAIEHRSFYIVNAILVKGSREVAEALAARPDVARVEGNPHIQNRLPEPGPAVEAPLYLQRPETIEPGINYTHAPQVWALGFTGQNIVVAGADTGIRWTHNALKPHYRGWDGQNADHNYNWHDSIHDSVGNPCTDSPSPCGDRPEPTPLPRSVTTAPISWNGAWRKWIGCRNMDVCSARLPDISARNFSWRLPNGGGQGDRPSSRHYQQLLGYPRRRRPFSYTLLLLKHKPRPVS
jgi:hypothetical protein